MGFTLASPGDQLLQEQQVLREMSQGTEKGKEKEEMRKKGRKEEEGGAVKGVIERLTEGWKEGKPGTGTCLAQLGPQASPPTPMESFLKSEPPDPAQASGWDSGPHSSSILSLGNTDPRGLRGPLRDGAETPSPQIHCIPNVSLETPP